MNLSLHSVFKRFLERWIQPTRRWALGLGLIGLGLLSACGGGSSGGSGAETPVAPTITSLSSDAGEVASDPFLVTVVFSAPVVIPDGTQLALCESSGTVYCNVKAGTLQAVAGATNTYTLQVIPVKQRKGLARIKIPAGAFKDSTGRVSNTVSYELPQFINTVGPNASFSPDSAGSLITGPLTVTMTFDSVLDSALTASQLLVSDGAISDFQKTSGAGANDVYTFRYTPPSSIGGSLTIVLPDGSVSAGGIKNGFNIQWGPHTLLVP